jgi:hypothetical protein
MLQTLKLQQQTLPKLKQFCDINGLYTTKLQQDIASKQRMKIEFDFWHQGIQMSLLGYRDTEFD